MSPLCERILSSERKICNKPQGKHWAECASEIWALASLEFPRWSYFHVDFIGTSEQLQVETQMVVVMHMWNLWCTFRVEAGINVRTTTDKEGLIIKIYQWVNRRRETIAAVPLAPLSSRIFCKMRYQFRNGVWHAEAFPPKTCIVAWWDFFQMDNGF